MPESPGVLLPGDSAQGLANSLLCCCGHTHIIVSSEQQQQQAQRGCALLFVLVTVFSWLSLASDPMEESHGDAESGGCARGFVTSSNPSAWPWLRCCTTRTTRCTPSTALHGARTQPPVPERRQGEDSSSPGVLPAVRRGRRRVGVAAWVGL